MVRFWRRATTPGDTQTGRVSTVRRRIYLATVFLVLLVNCHAFVVNRSVVSSLSMRTFSYTIAVCSIGLLLYSTYWFWKSRRQEKSEPLRSLRFYLATLLLLSLANCNYLMLNSAVSFTMLRVFNYSLIAYSVGLFAYSNYWFWMSRVVRSRGRQSRDPLTGLLDWQGLSHRLRNGYSSSSAQGRDTKLIYVDMIGLDRINVEYGQPFGDSVLRGVAELLESRTPTNCTVGRVGGDEFLAILKDCDETEAQELADAILREMDNFSLGESFRGRVSGLRARVKVLPFGEGGGALRQSVAAARAEAAFQSNKIRSAGGGRARCYSLPDVTVGACALFLWDELEVSVRNEFTVWRQAPGGEFLSKIATDLIALLGLKAEARPFDFVTAPPESGGAEQTPAVHHLAEELARLMGIPFRPVLAASGVSAVVGYADARVVVPIKKGSYVLLVADLIEESVSLRSCVRTLSAAGAFVQVVGWAVKAPA